MRTTLCTCHYTEKDALHLWLSQQSCETGVDKSQRARATRHKNSARRAQDQKLPADTMKIVVLFLLLQVVALCSADGPCAKGKKLTYTFIRAKQDEYQLRKPKLYLRAYYGKKQVGFTRVKYDEDANFKFTIDNYDPDKKLDVKLYDVSLTNCQDKAVSSGVFECKSDFGHFDYDISC
ncbi:hypothetical protein WMY93_003386 [Mugilogobius chulae]|uniref:Uncharacterized protein n=1 Tax=Mugilogobius chulae TaxID=88201 RepID=A0AAW0PXB5_9GOBI